MRKSHRLDKMYVMSLLEAIPPEVLEQEVDKLGSVQGRALSEYKYCIVMPQGDRSFQAIHSSERPNLDHVRNLLRTNFGPFVATYVKLWMSDSSILEGGGGGSASTSQRGHRPP
jgi:hypothetical protein